MLNLIDLEARWLRYKLRTFMPYIALFLAVLIGLVVLFYYLGTQSAAPKSQTQTPQKEIERKVEATQSEPQIEVQTQPQEPTQTQIQEPLQTQKPLQTQAVKPTQTQTQEPLPTQAVEPIQTQTQEEMTPPPLKPSMDFMRHINTSSVGTATSQQAPVNPYVNGSFQSDNEPMSFEPAQNYEEEIIETSSEPEVYEPVVSKKIDIERRDADEDIQAVIKRFNKNNNPALSLFVAKKYYEMGDYKSAYNYALITNNINADIEASWLIFAKSLVKLGKKELAARTLQEYIQNSRSKSASRLLDDILNGKFK